MKITTFILCIYLLTLALLPSGASVFNHSNTQTALNQQQSTCRKTKTENDTKSCCSKTKKNKCHNKEEGKCACKFKIHNNLLSFIQIEINSKIETLSTIVFPTFNTRVPYSMYATIWLPPKIS